MAYPLAPISDLCSDVVVGHVGPSSSYRQIDGIPFLMGKNIGPGHLKLAELERVTPAFHQAQKKSQLRGGDIVVVRIGKSGMAAMITDDLGEANCSGLVIIKKPTQIDAKFLVHYLNSEDGRRQSIAEAKGATRQTLNTKSIASALVPVPPLPEQRRIAAILDQAESLRAKRRSALAKLGTLAQSIFVEMFGDPIRMGWDMSSIGDIADPKNGSIRTGPFGSQLLHSEFTESGVAVLGIDNAVANEFRWGERRYISQAKYQQLKRYTVKPGDVIITIMGTCGRCAIVPDGIPIAINTKHLCCITPNRLKCLPEFLHAYFLLHPIARKHLQQTAKGAIMDGLNMGLIKSMPIPVPPMELQRNFSRQIGSLGAMKSHSAKSLNQIDALFASLQHRAFRGEL